MEKTALGEEAVLSLIIHDKPARSYSQTDLFDHTMYKGKCKQDGVSVTANTICRTWESSMISSASKRNFANVIRWSWGDKSTCGIL